MIALIDNASYFCLAQLTYIHRVLAQFLGCAATSYSSTVCRPNLILVERSARQPRLASFLGRMGALEKLLGAEK